MTGGWYSNGLLQKPRLLRGVDVNNMDYEKERDMTWTELFFDLIFVTATTRLGDLLRGRTEPGRVHHLFPQHVRVLERIRHVRVSLRSRRSHTKLFCALYMTGMVLMTAHATADVSSMRFQWLCGAAMFTKLLLVLSYLRVSWFLKEARFFVGSLVVRLLVDVFLLALAIFLPVFAPWKPMLFTFMALVTYAYALLLITVAAFSSSKRLYLPLHLEHFTERAGGFIIIVLGVSIDNIATIPRVESWYYSLSIVTAFFLVFAVKLLHFDTDARELHFHALRVNKYKGALWNMTMPLVACSIAFVGVSLKLVIQAANQQVVDFDHGQYYLAMSVGCTLIFMVILTLCHSQKFDLNLYSEEKNGNTIMRRVFRFQIACQSILACFCLFIAHYRFWDPLALLVTLFVAITVLVAINLIDEALEREYSPPEIPTSPVESLLSHPKSATMVKRRYFELIEMMDLVSDDELREGLQSCAQDLFHSHPCTPSTPGRVNTYGAIDF